MKTVTRAILCFFAISFFAFMPALAISSNTAEKAGNNAEGRITILAVGDSLTEGLYVDQSEAYPALLEKRLAKEGCAVNVVNAGVSGETSAGTLARISWLMNLNPDIVILETGANDGLRGLDPSVAKENIEKIVRKLKNENVVVVLAGMKMFVNLGKEYTQEFNDIYPSVAKEEKVILVPFFLEGVANVPRLNHPDGIHPTSEGYEKVVDVIYPFVLEAIERVKNKQKGEE